MYFLNLDLVNKKILKNFIFYLNDPLQKQTKLIAYFLKKKN